MKRGRTPARILTRPGAVQAGGPEDGSRKPRTPMPASLIPPAPALPDIDGGTSCFVIGQDRQGCWVAAEIHGRAGGLFRSRQDALHYAVDATAHRPDAVRIAADGVELHLGGTSAVALDQRAGPPSSSGARSR